MKFFTSILFIPFWLFPLSVAAASPAPSAAAPSESPSSSVTNPKPTLIPYPGTDQVRLKLVNCSWGPDCILASFLPKDVILPQSNNEQNPQLLQFDNPSASPAQILSVATILRSNSGYQLTDAFSIPDKPITLAANKVVNIPLAIRPDKIPPGQYGGAIYLTIQGQTNRLVLPVTLNVRSGPMIPLVILVIGIILGRLFKYMQEQGGPQSEAREKVYRLERDIKDAHPDDQRLLAEMLKKARKLVYDRQIESANTQITVVQSRLDVLNQVRTIENSWQEQKAKGVEIPDEFFGHIDQVRLFIQQEADAKAKETLSQIIEIVGATPRGSNTPDSAVVGNMVSALRSGASNLDQNARSLATEPPPSSKCAGLQRIVIGLSGLSDLVRVEATYWFLRPFLYIMLLVLLTLTGMNSLYIEKGENFGEKPLSDYLALLLWGLSADVASRSLSGLQGPKEPAAK
jgi:hypothetical protein